MVRAGAVMDDWVHPIPSIEGPGTFGLGAELLMTVLPTAPQLAAGAYGPGASRIWLRCQLLTQGGFMDFARRRAWELCRRAKSEPDRNFVTCQPLAAEGDDRSGTGCCAGAQFYRSCHDLSFCLIRYPHDISLQDVGVL